MTLKEELKQIIETNDRYEDFILLENPVKLKDMLANQNVECIQLHSTQTFETPVGKDIVGFCGVCAWIDNNIKSLDGDSYYEDMTIYGYSWWSNEEEGIKKGLDVLVGNDW